MGHSASPAATMKLLVLSCLLASAFALPTCDECYQSMDKLVALLSSEDSITRQIGALVPAICPESEDPAMCEEMIVTAWGDIGRAMYPVFLEGTCDECVSGINSIGGLIADPATIEEVITFLRGDDFCGMHTEVATCPEDIAHLMPLAMPVLAGVLIAGAEGLCMEINGVC